MYRKPLENGQGPAPPRVGADLPTGSALARGFGWLARCAAWLVLALSSYWAVRGAWADYLSDGADLSGRERALQLVPLAEFAERVAERREELGGDPVADLRRAAALDPENAERWMRLGVRAELAGDYAMAEASLLSAVARSRLYQPRYLLAQYYFRRQDEGRFWPWARAALEASYGDAAPVFELCWRMRPDAVWLSAHAIPPRDEVRRQYLGYLMSRERWQAAAAEARLRLASAEAPDRKDLLAYAEACLFRGEAGEAVETWNGLCRRHLLSEQALEPGGNLVTNGDFRHAPLGLGFDWHIVEPPGVSAEAAPGELRVIFTGTEEERCGVAWQFVPTVPGSRYRLSWEARGDDDLPAPGMVWEIPGATVQQQQARSLELVAAKDLSRLMLMYVRPAGSARLEDTVRISHVRLERAP